MADQNNKSGGVLGPDFRRDVSHKKKVANDFARQKHIMDSLDLWGGDYRDWKQIDKSNINFDLFNGRLDVSLYDDPVCLNIEGEKINFELQSITHYPLISQVANSIYGEMISRPFNPIAKDIGSLSQTLVNKKWNELLREYISQSIIVPIQEEVFSTVCGGKSNRRCFAIKF